MDNIEDIDDNIAEQPAAQPVVQPADAQPAVQSQAQPVAQLEDPEDAYLKKFEELDACQDVIDNLAASLGKQANDQQRLYAAIEIIKALCKKSRMQDDLLVEMNNYFGAK